MKNDSVDWNDPALARWIGTISNPKTMKNCKTAFRIYAQFTGKTASELIDEAIEDFKRDPRERQDIVLKRLIGFYNWLKTDYVRRKAVGGGNGEVIEVGKGIAGRSCLLRVNIIRGFYSTFDITVRMKGKNKLPKAKVENKRMVFKPEDVWKVKALVDHGRTTRDRAIVLFHFQGGLDVSTLCSLDYGDIKEGLEKNEHPLKIEPMRVKTGVEFYTFVGQDAIDAIKAYLADMKSRDIEFTNRTPLFLQDRGKERLKTNNIQTMMKDLAVRSGFVTEGNNGNGFNPLGTHSLRESFGSLMINSGVPDSIVDFWLGHEVGDMASAYKQTQFENLRQMYLDREHLLSISAPKGESEKTKAEVKEVKDDLYQLHFENKQMKQEIKSLKDQIGNMYEFVHKNLDPMLDLIDEISNTPEGVELLKKLNAKKQAIQEEYDRSGTGD